MICVLKGDGIGPEVMAQALRVLEAVAPSLKYEEALVGGASIDAYGEPLTDKVLALAKSSQAVLFGAIGGPSWDKLPARIRPEAGLLRLRAELGVFANLRPAAVYDALLGHSSLKPEVLRGTDILIVRELTGGIYFGKPRGRKGSGASEEAYDTMIYSRLEIERVAAVAFDAARARRGKLCLVDKANVLESSRLWREVVAKMAEDYEDVELSYMYVDNAAMQLIKQPSEFDVILTENLFGDILSDEAAMITGSIGLLASASTNGGAKGMNCKGLFEPVHGSAPDIAGKNIANPVAAVLSAAMMLDFALDMKEEARRVERAVVRTISEGFLCADLGGEVSCSDMGDLILERL